MPGWIEIINEIDYKIINDIKRELNHEKNKLTEQIIEQTITEQTKKIHTTTVHKYLKGLSTYTKRNTIIYYSGWLKERRYKTDSLIINDSDKNGFMAVIHKLDKDKGLDLILHTPGAM